MNGPTAGLVLSALLWSPALAAPSPGPAPDPSASPSPDPTTSPGPEPVPAPDLIPPGKTELRLSGGADPRFEVEVSWTAVGDDGNQSGTRVVRYELRYSAAGPIGTMEQFNVATRPGNPVPAPSLAGAAMRMVVTDLVPGMTYHFALLAVDDASPANGSLSSSGPYTTEGLGPAASGGGDGSSGAGCQGASPAEAGWGLFLPLLAAGLAGRPALRGRS